MADARHARILTSLAIGAVVVSLTACGAPDPDREPGPNDLEGFEFEPVATIEVSEVGIDPTELAAELGDIVLVENTGDEPARVRGDHLDTGDMEPGESVTVVLSNEGELEWELVSVGDEMSDLGEAGIITIDVEPAASSGAAE